MTAGEQWLVSDSQFDLSSVDPASTAGAPGDKAKTNAALDELGDQLASLQERLWAEGRRALLLVLQGLDTSGKDGTIRHVFHGVNALGLRVTSFKAPSEDERRHDFLWRVHRAAPAAGEIGIFNRSHYEDVLIVRVHDWVPEAEWRARYGAISDFERHLAESGATIVKCWLHLSPEEQAKRLRARLDDPTKRWKFNHEDLGERTRWHDYMAAAEEMLRQTSSPGAPWYVVPADHKWYRNWAVSRIVTETLAAMDPQYPEPPDLDHIDIPEV
jgi:PPK2 family polyphosphate:nucleotide phosphotransferase